MKLIDGPQVFCIAEPKVRPVDMLEYLKLVTLQNDGGRWWERVGSKVALSEIPDSEGLVEFMGRLCYKSWEPGLNKNVLKIREDRGEYLLNILRSAHGSVLEHAFFSFAIHDCSRVLTAELNRHRAGVAISEQSLRFVRLDDIRFWLPDDGLMHPESYEDMIACVEYIERTIKSIYEREGLDNMEAFAQKKKHTSRIRRIAPLGLATEEGWSANVRTLRHVITMRSAEGAEEEIRLFADELGKIMSTVCPLLFQDFTAVPSEGAVPTWSPEHNKV